MSAKALVARWWQHRWVRRGVAGFALALATVVGLQVYAQSQRWQIDPTAGLKLSEAQRKEFDQIFFEEIVSLFEGTKRYSPTNWREERYRDFERMARAGYVPAQAYMRLVGRDWVNGHPDRGGYEKLLEAANLGDMSAACALPLFGPWTRDWSHVKEAEQVRFFLEPIQRGAAKGHWGCYAPLASAYWTGRHGLPVDKKKALQLFVESALAGDRDIPAFLTTDVVLGALPFSIARENVRFCWGAVRAPLSETTLRYVFNGLYLLRNKAPLAGDNARQAEIQRLIDEWVMEISPTKLIHKMATPQECARLQQELGDVSIHLK